jgi:AraC-like DNA-binding protein
MVIQTNYVKTPFLSKYIAYYYFIKSDQPDFSASYYAFPNVYNGLSICRSAQCQSASKGIEIQSDNLNAHQAFIIARYQFPLLVKLTGPVDMVNIVFKPLGVNHFIKSNFACVTRKLIQPFDEWGRDNHRTFLSALFLTDDHELRVRLLDEFLLSAFHYFDDMLVMEKALGILSDLEREYTMQQLANNLNVSTRTLNRLFLKHLGLSPVTYRKVMQFRQSLKSKLFDDQFKRLTDVAYANNFYDPSYFNRIYKQFTGSTPKLFFNSINNIGNNAPLFQYVK